MNESKIKLPAPVLESDIYDIRDWDKNQGVKYAIEDYKNPVYTQYGGTIEFELWYTERFGWVIPTLTIRNNTGRAARAETRRSYAIAIKDGAMCSAGMGPHVKRHVTIRVKQERFEALKPLLDIMIKGGEKAGDIRDRRSTRIAQGRARRSNFLGGGDWDR